MPRSLNDLVAFSTLPPSTASLVPFSARAGLVLEADSKSDEESSASPLLSFRFFSASILARPVLLLRIVASQRGLCSCDEKWILVAAPRFRLPRIHNPGRRSSKRRIPSARRFYFTELAVLLAYILRSWQARGVRGISGHAQVGKPKQRRLANWLMVRGPQPGAVTSQDIYSTAACGAVDVLEYRRRPRACWPGRLSVASAKT